MFILKSYSQTDVSSMEPRADLFKCMYTARRGVTVLEVLFATGIAVFGLVGIVSLLAVAGRQASDSNNWAEGQAAAQIALNSFVVRGYTHSAWWAAFDDQISGPVPSHFVRLNSLGSISRSTFTGGIRTGNRHAICIDPYFFSDPTTVENVNSNFPISIVPGVPQRYRPSLFPYYQDDFNPRDPTTRLLTGNAGRLLRVGLMRPDEARPMSAKAVDRQFQMLDDLAIATDDVDTTQPAARAFSAGGAQGLTNGQYSWFATLCPREVTSRTEVPNVMSPEDLFTLSIVVCKRRDRAFYVPGDGQQGPLGERVVDVTPSADFRGGSGGRVALSAASVPLDPSLDISDSLSPGDWVMLCRESRLVGGNLMTICRWYRVLTLDIEPTIAGGVWSRNVILDGPDWSFDAQFPTQATLVSGVVTVVERVVSVR